MLYADSTGKIDQNRLNALGDQLAPVYRTVPGVTAVTQMLVPPFLGTGIFVGRLDLEGQTPEEMKSNPVYPWKRGAPTTSACTAFRFCAAEPSPRPTTTRPRTSPSSASPRRRKLWPNENPIGKRIHFWSADSTTLRTVVGVAGDMHYRSLRESTAEIYLPWKQSYWQGSFAIRTTGNLASVLPALRRATAEVNPGLTLWQADPMDDLIAKPLAQPRMSALLLAVSPSCRCCSPRSDSTA